MSRRQTSVRLIACASEAKVAWDAHKEIHSSIVSLLNNFGALEKEVVEKTLQDLVLHYMPTSILNSLSELEHFRLHGKKIATERVRRQSKSSETREVDSSSPDIHPYPEATLPILDDLIGTSEEREAFENWKKGQDNGQA